MGGPSSPVEVKPHLFLVLCPLQCRETFSKVSGLLLDPVCTDRLYTEKLSGGDDELVKAQRILG